MQGLGLMGGWVGGHSFLGGCVSAVSWVGVGAICWAGDLPKGLAFDCLLCPD